jgi:DNA-binding NarL/FixJ family response regulator
LVVHVETVAVEMPELERTIVTLLAHGHTVASIAATINMSTSGVERQIQICRQRLQARNNSELVAKALSSGLYSA